MEPPPLEEFKRLMESLGPESMFDEDYLDATADSADGDDEESEEYVDQPKHLSIVHCLIVDMF
jgi:hypothetical protein